MIILAKILLLKGNNMEFSMEEENLLMKCLEKSDAIWILLLILGFKPQNDTNNETLSEVTE